VAATPRHLGARIGFLAILHTWGQNLLHHPHLHCVVPAGGVALDGSRWVACRRGFFLPVRVLGRLYRGKLLALLEEAYQAGSLEFHGRLAELRSPRAFQNLLARARALEWVVYAKPPFGGPEAVLKYLARYTHRVALSNHRLLEVTHEQVRFTWKDYRQGHRQRVMTLELSEFARRFLLHVLPYRFVKIRYYGFLAQSQRAKALPRCHELLGTAPRSDAEPPCASPDGASDMEQREPRETAVCPQCQRGRLVHVRALIPGDTS
jgi:hypothetical protein